MTAEQKDGPPGSARQRIPGLLSLALAGFLLLGFVAVVWINPDAGPAANGAKALPDGSSLELVAVAFTNKFGYQHRSTPRWLRPLSPLIPDAIENRFWSGGSMQIGGGETNLVLATVRRGGGGAAGAITLERARLTDENGHVAETGVLAGTLGFAAEVVNIWNVRAFNRRSKAFEVEWIGRQGDGSLVSIGPFAIANPVPVPSDHPQFHPEPLPQHKSSGNLVVTLEGFVSGIPAGDREPSGKGDLLPKTTRLELAFNENQNPSTNYRLQRLIVSDATGNRWQPYFDHARPRSNERVDGGTAILPGALWPSEQAWKLEVEVLRHEYFAPEELWAPPPLPLDAGPRYLPLGHQFAAGSGSIQLANLVPPGLIASNQWQWTVRYWGNESNVFAVGVQFPEPMPNRRLLVVEATDDSGRAVPLVEHRGADHPQQALLFRPEPDATQLQLRLAVPELHRVEFLARPEFHPRK